LKITSLHYKATLEFAMTPLCVQEAYLQLKEQAEGFQQETLKAQVSVAAVAVAHWWQAFPVICMLHPTSPRSSRADVLRQELLRKVAEEREARDEQLFIKVCPTT
jgi:hypothetical protein